MSQGGTRVRARRLSRYSSADGLEKNCAQHLILGPAGCRTWSHDASDVTKVVGTMKYKPVTAANSFLGLSADAFAALAFLHTRYVLQDMPETGVVEFSTRDLLGAVGRTACSDADCPPEVVELMDELLNGSFFGILSRYNGELVRGELKGIESYAISDSGVCEVVLPAFVAENLQHDFTAYLDHDTLLELKRANPDAMRLWIYAEAQNLKNSKFAKDGLPACIFRQRYTDKNRTLTIEELLSLPKGNQTKALEQVHDAVDQANTTDPRYEMRVELGRSWLVVFKRGDLGKPRRTIVGASAPSTKPSTAGPTSSSTTSTSNTSPSTSPNPSTGTATAPSIAVSPGDASTASPDVVAPESPSPPTTTSVVGSSGRGEAVVDAERCDRVEAVTARASRGNDGGRKQQHGMTATKRSVDTRDSDFTTVGDAARRVLDSMANGTWIGERPSRDPARCIDERPHDDDSG